MRLVFLLSLPLVQALSLSNGSLSYIPARISQQALSSSTASHGIEGYVLAALSSASSSPSSTTPSAQSQISHSPASDRVAAAASVKSSTANSTSSPASVASQTHTTSFVPSTVCQYGTCYTDVSYTSVNIASTGTGMAYASSCAAALVNYTSASNAWVTAHQSVSVETVYNGYTTTSTVTFYSAASTLCDGHPRVDYSPAIATSTSLTTIVVAPTVSASVETMTIFTEFPVETPNCSIDPTDCDALYVAYSSTLSAIAAESYSAMATSAPVAPPCENSSQIAAAESAESFVTQCGPCTMFGEGVQLFYFPEPTTVSRDMCASTPTATLTSYTFGDGAELLTTTTDGSNGTTSAANLKTAVFNGHTFTSGTAYISIASVWAEDRCSSTLGTVVTDAILAMPSESVLSLRYSQDHFEYFDVRQTQTGYPFNFADLNHPIPWSAWNGQQACRCPTSGCGCDTIYEEQYRPQLAIPPAIRGLRSEYASCQVWYGGLYDPPHTLTTETEFDVPTSTASTRQTVSQPTVQATALAESTTGPVTSASATLAPVTTTTVDSFVTPTSFVRYTIQIGGLNADASNDPVSVYSSPIYMATTDTALVVPSDTTAGTGNGRTAAAAVTGKANSDEAGQTGSTDAGDGTAEATAAAQSNGASQTAALAAQGNGASRTTAAVQGNEGSASPVTEAVLEYSGNAKVLVVGSQSISVGGSALTLSNGQVLSLASSGIVQAQYSTVDLSGNSDGSGTGSSDSGNTQATGSSADGQAPQSSSGVAVLTLAGQAVTVSRVSGSSNVAVVGTATVSLDGSAQTLAGGAVVSLASGGLVVGQATTIPYTSVTNSGSSTATKSTGTSSTTSSPTVTSVMNTKSLQTTAKTTSTKSGASSLAPFASALYASMFLACLVDGLFT